MMYLHSTQMGVIALLLVMVVGFASIECQILRANALKLQSQLQGVLEATNEVVRTSMSSQVDLVSTVTWGEDEATVENELDAVINYGNFVQTRGDAPVSNPQFVTLMTEDRMRQAAEVAGLAARQRHQQAEARRVKAEMLMKMGHDEKGNGFGGGFGGGPGKPGNGFGGHSTGVKLVEINTEIQTQVEVSTKTAALPGANVGPANTLVSVRNTVRGGVADPAAPMTVDGFTYTIDAGNLGRVVGVQGMIAIPVGARPGLGQSAVDYCDVLYDPNGAAGGFTARSACPAQAGSAAVGRRVQQAGHIIAFRLGGSNSDPLNFYPQNVRSNNQGGRWGRIEAIALRVKRDCGHPIQVFVQFHTWINQVNPATGVYAFAASALCHAAVCGGGGHAYTRAFCANAQLQPGGSPFGVGTYLMSTGFSNDVGDTLQRPRDDHLYE